VEPSATSQGFIEAKASMMLTGLAGPDHVLSLPNVVMNAVATETAPGLSTPISKALRRLQKKRIFSQK
jgi:hypothetical protein